MKKVIILLATLIIITLSSCTERQRAKDFGGTSTCKLKKNEVLINITWKDSDMWVLTEDTITHQKYFRESSSWGIWNGEVEITNNK